MQKDIPRGTEDGVARTACWIPSRVVGHYLARLGEGTEKYDETLVVRWGCTDTPWMQYVGQLCEEGSTDT